MKRNRRLSRCLIWLLTVCLLLSGCGGNAAPAAAEAAETTKAILEETAAPETTEVIAEETAAPETAEAMAAEAAAEETNEISVAIYPYIPDKALFRDILVRQWEAIEPDVELTFVDWDCYEEPDPAQIDVLMYDAMFTTYLAAKGHIQPIPEEALLDSEGILDFAVEGAHHDGELYGVPYLVCSDFLVHRTDDAELAAVKNMKELYDVFTARKQINPNDGLAIKYYAHYPYYYLDALIDFSGNYTIFDEAPDTSVPDQQVYNRLCQIRDCLPANVDLEDLMKDSRRCRMFADGNCSAYYGYSEDISLMDGVHDEITVRTVSFSEKDNIQMFFADIASMGAHVTDPAEQERCIKLMNLIGSEEFLQELCFGTEDVQYMLPARMNVYIPAQEKYPVYGQLRELVMDERNQIARFGVEIFDYLAVAYEDLA